MYSIFESVAQRIELLDQLRQVDPVEVPVNFLKPRPGTPLADRGLVAPMEALCWIALLRLALPAVLQRYAGGREVTLRELQASCAGRRRPLDPPRFCPECRRRLTVRVTPARVVARCRDHGEIACS